MPDVTAALVERTLQELRAAGQPARAAGAAAYFKAYEDVTFFGVDTPTVRAMVRRLRRDDCPSWRVADAIRFAETMMAEPQLEAKAVGICLLGTFHREFNPPLLARTKRWLDAWCTDWATADALCGEVIGPLLVAHPGLVPALRRWRTSRHLYVRRASAVALIRPVRSGLALDDAYDAAGAIGADEHHLLQKAAGWLLREAGKRDRARLERFLRRDGRRLSRTTVRYAIEPFEPSRRAALLRATAG